MEKIISRDLEAALALTVRTWCFPVEHKPFHRASASDKIILWPQASRLDQASGNYNQVWTRQNQSMYRPQDRPNTSYLVSMNNSFCFYFNQSQTLFSLCFSHILDKKLRHRNIRIPCLFWQYPTHHREPHILNPLQHRLMQFRVL